jgi:outer membrane protein TolC
MRTQVAKTALQFLLKPCLAAYFSIFQVGCSITPEQLTSDENQSRAVADRLDLQKNQEAVAGAISIHEAIARALKYNLDYRVELMQQSLAQKDLDLSQYDMLPKLTANLGYDARDNWSGANSRSLLTGRQSLEPSTSADRDIFTAKLGLTWNVLDFGVSYFRAHQAADKVLAREEQKRKVVNRIIQDVTTAYWRAVSNERLKSQMAGLADRVEAALNQSKQIMEKKLSNPMAALSYRRELFGIQRELQQLQRNLAIAKSQLAALMNLQPGADFQLLIPERLEWTRFPNTHWEKLEQIALESRPELRSLVYEKRAVLNEAKAALVAMLPGLEFGGNYNYSSNSFLFNSDWWNIGSQLAWNLMSLVRYPAKMAEIEAQKNLLDTERLAMSMAVLTQLHLGFAQYAHAQSEFSTASDFQATQSQLARLARAGLNAGSVSEQSLIREDMNCLTAEVRRDVTYAELENAYATILAAIGADPLPPGVRLDQPIAALTADIAVNTLSTELFQ